jgi:hypothetical protein
VLYNRYALGNLIVNTLGSLQYTLATDTMLQSVESLSGSNTSGISAGMNYIGKDLIGQTFSLWFMQRIGKYSDRNPKLFFNSILGLQQTAMLAETLTFTATGSYMFLGVAGTANIAKNIAFCGTGAINARVIGEIVKTDSRENGEVYSHLTTIASLGSSFGMALGIGTIYLLPDPSTRAVLVPIIGALKYTVMRWSLKGIYL